MLQKTHILLLLLCLSISNYLFGNTVIVQNTNDNGNGSLRFALNAAQDGDTIRFNSNLIGNGNDTIFLDSTLTLNKDVHLVGLYSLSDTLYISGATNNKILKISSTSAVTLDSLAFTNGFTSSNSSGVIESFRLDTIIVKNCVFKNINGSGISVYWPAYFSAIGYADIIHCHFDGIFRSGIVFHGGKISGKVIGCNLTNCSTAILSTDNDFGTTNGVSVEIIVDSCKIKNNGSGILHDGVPPWGTSYSSKAKFTINNSVVSNNQTTGINIHILNDHDSISATVDVNNCLIQFNGDTISYGGGISVHCYNPMNLYSIISATIKNSTISHNKAGKGGGISCFGSKGNYAHKKLQVVNSTISNNIATSEGGAIYFYSSGFSEIDLINSTIAENTASTFGGIVQERGSLSTTSSIIALNSPKSYHNYIYNTVSGITSGGYNIFTDTNLLSTALDPTDQLNVDSLSLNLDTLKWNGGFTPTRVPLPYSVALNSGNPLDSSDAQNTPIIGIRESGAAEICYHTISENIISCGPYTWIDGNTYYESDSSYFVIDSPLGCDTAILLYLSIIGDTTHYIHSACDSFTWINGITYTTSNDTALYIIPNGTSNGCDSIVQLHLEINQSTIGHDTISTCDSLTWIDGITYFSSNNTASYTIVNGNSSGCDSTVFLNLTINSSTYAIDQIVVCDSLTWIDGTTYYSSNNTAIHNLLGANATGCDSIVQLDLTILSPTVSIDSITSCDSLTWINGITYHSTTDSVFHTFQGAASNGCDSIIQLDLTILSTSYTIDSVFSCEPYVWIDGNTYFSSNSTASYTFPNGQANGCDSIVYLNLTVEEIDNTVTTNGAVIQSHAQNATYQWIDCSSGLPIAGATSDTLLVSQSGWYSVAITQNNCTDTSDCVNVHISTIEENTSPFIDVFPNPAKDFLIVKQHSNTKSRYSVQLINTAGAVVLSDSSIEHEILINLKNLSSGVYFLRIEGQFDPHIQKMIIE